MAHYYDEPSRTFSEYLLIPGFTDSVNTPDRVDLSTPLTKFRPGVEEPFIRMNIPIGFPFRLTLPIPIRTRMSMMRKLMINLKESRIAGAV